MNSAKANALTAAIAELPRVQLASIRPTPLEPLPRLTAHLRLSSGRSLDSPALYIKRDDLNRFGLWRQQDADVRVCPSRRLD